MTSDGDGPERCVRSLSDGDVALWVEQGAIHIRAFDPGPDGPGSRPGPHRDPVELTEDEARELSGMLLDLAREAGEDPALEWIDGGPRMWIDPVTEKQALRIDRGHRHPVTGEPYANPLAAGDHSHAFNDGKRVRDREGDSHLPIDPEMTAGREDGTEIMDPGVVGKLFEVGARTPYRHPRLWSREAISGVERLCVGGGERSAALLGDLAGCLPGPLFVVAVLGVAHAGKAEKLESEPLDIEAVVRFLDDFRELFENDARAEAWVGATSGEGLLVLDEHDLIYAYGPLDDFEEILVAREFEGGDPGVSFEHLHRFNAELDHMELRLREWGSWRRALPLDDEEE